MESDLSPCGLVYWWEGIAFLLESVLSISKYPALMSQVTSLSQEEKDAIIYDAREGDLEFLTEVFTKMAPPSLLPTIKEETTLITPVHAAAANGHIDVVKYLLSLLPKEEAEAFAAIQNDSGNTALHWAAYNGHLEVCQLLAEEYHVNVFIRNHAGHDAIYEAGNNSKEEVENWFLKQYAIEDNVKVEDTDNGNTKVTYTPGKESKEVEERAAAALAQQQRVDSLGTATEKMNIS